jgi:hypothetical protein
MQMEPVAADVDEATRRGRMVDGRRLCDHLSGRERE